MSDTSSLRYRLQTCLRRLYQLRQVYTVFIVLLLANAAVAWHTYHTEVSLLHNEHHKLAALLVENAGKEIEGALSRQHRTLHHFSQDHLSILEEIVAKSDETHLIEARQKLQRYLPGLLALNLLDRTGGFVFLSPTFEGIVDQLCLRDAKAITHGETPRIRIHPNPHQYHYDQVVALPPPLQQYHLFATFSQHPLVEALAEQNIPGHQLYVIILQQDGALIEFSAQGDRQTLLKKGLPSRLTAADLEGALAIKAIPGTDWHVVDLPEPTLFSYFEAQTLKQTLWLFGFTTAVLLFFFFLLRHHTLTIEQQKARLAAQASADGLTGLANRRAFDAALIREWHRGARNQTPLSLIMLDIDYFKRWNDTLGHLAGDDILRTLADTVRQQVKRHADLVARYGGEEIAVLLPETPHDAACALAERIRQAVEALDRKNTAVPSGHLTVSLGVCTCIPNPDLPPDPSLIACADEALYRAKRGGRNRVECNHMPKCQGTELTSSAQSE